MSTTARQFTAAKATRDRTRAAFDGRLAKVKQDLEARGVGGRIADKVSEDARAVLEEAQDFAGTHRGLIAGTIAALMLWLLRHPLIAGLERLFGRDD